MDISDFKINDISTHIFGEIIISPNKQTNVSSTYTTVATQINRILYKTILGSSLKCSGCALSPSLYPGKPIYTYTVFTTSHVVACNVTTDLFGTLEDLYSEGHTLEAFVKIGAINIIVTFAAINFDKNIIQTISRTYSSTCPETFTTHEHALTWGHLAKYVPLAFFEAMCDVESIVRDIPIALEYSRLKTFQEIGHLQYVVAQFLVRAFITPTAKPAQIQNELSKAILSKAEPSDDSKEMLESNSDDGQMLRDILPYVLSYLQGMYVTERNLKGTVRDDD